MSSNDKIYNAYIARETQETVLESDLYALVQESTISENGVITNLYEQVLINQLGDETKEDSEVAPRNLDEAYTKVHYIPDEMFLNEE